MLLAFLTRKDFRSFLNFQIFLELCSDGSKNLCETPKVSSIDCSAVQQPVKRTIVKPKLWCSLCGERFECEINLIEHISFHENGSTLYCSICNFSTTTAKIMRKHLITDHKEYFGTDSSLTKHYRCFHCKMKSNSKRKMEIHVDTHFEKKNDSCFECEICKKQYLSHASLRKHKIIHAGIKPFVCEICGDSFVYKPYLQSHMKTHGDPKPFVCTFCNSRFTSKMKVTRHERIHTGEKPYQCDKCSFKSARSDGLYNHRLSIHSKLKPYECDKCGQCFSMKTKFKQHYQKAHMPGCAFRCRECEKTFKSKATLASHIKFYGHHEDTEYAFSQIWVC